MSKGEKNDHLMSFALRRIGMKKMKIIIKSNAISYFHYIVRYLNSRKLPEWLKIKYDDLMNNKI